MDKFYCETQLSDRISKTPEGFLVCHDVPITVAGDMYYTADQFGGDIKPKNGHVRVAKNIEDIHSEDTIRSFEGKPITLGHPKDESGRSVFVTPENAKDLTHGVVQNVRPGSGKSFDKLLADFVIMDKEAIALVESGELREVSCGYTYEAANIQDGFFEQTNMRGNHVALVPRGRAGPQCAIFDSKEDKSMSLKDRLKEALKVFQSAVDAAEEDERERDDEDEEEEEEKGDKKKKAKKKGEKDEKPMAVRKKMKSKVKKSKMAEDAKEYDEDEDDMEQAEEDMGMVKVHSRLDRVEELLSDLAEKLREMAEEDDEDEDEDEADEGEARDSYDSLTVSNAEILAPGIAKKGKDLKRRALDEFKKTQSGSKILKQLLGSKSFDSVDTDMLFTASAALVSAERSGKMSKASAYDAAAKTTNYSTVGAINEANADFWAKNKLGANQ